MGATSERGKSRLIVNNRKIYNDFSTEGRAGMIIPEEEDAATHPSASINLQ
jgi:hypothetical protein